MKRIKLWFPMSKIQSESNSQLKGDIVPKKQRQNKSDTIFLSVYSWVFLQNYNIYFPNNLSKPFSISFRIFSSSFSLSPMNLL